MSSKILMSYMEDDYKIKPFSIIFLKMNTYVKSYDGETIWIYFLIEDDEMFKKIHLE